MKRIKKWARGISTCCRVKEHWCSCFFVLDPIPKYYLNFDIVVSILVCMLRGCMDLKFTLSTESFIDRWGSNCLTTIENKNTICVEFHCNEMWSVINFDLVSDSYTNIHIPVVVYVRNNFRYSNRTLMSFIFTESIPVRPMFRVVPVIIGSIIRLSLDDGLQQC